ncbi:hypothetical protein FA95DRAFT_765277 [Auriscalpium vulgare]|uniref:Uncharacterized protein n=1 Tax=Auriscalpium vulgare TaxID=40419 RepID=A0ACB8RB70_9AGAM|nr:hypothetical protein FA95DRAFT_765277 [Auriscalpium vulgare]
MTPSPTLRPAVQACTESQNRPLPFEYNIFPDRSRLPGYPSHYENVLPHPNAVIANTMDTLPSYRQEDPSPPFPDAFDVLPTKAFSAFQARVPDVPSVADEPMPSLPRKERKNPSHSLRSLDKENVAPRSTSSSQRAPSSYDDDFNLRSPSHRHKRSSKARRTHPYNDERTAPSPNATTTANSQQARQNARREEPTGKKSRTPNAESEKGRRVARKKAIFALKKILDPLGMHPKTVIDTIAAVVPALDGLDQENKSLLKQNGELKRIVSTLYQQLRPSFSFAHPLRSTF